MRLRTQLGLALCGVALVAPSACKKKQRNPDKSREAIEIVRIDAAPPEPQKPQVFVLSEVRIATADTAADLEIYQEELAKRLGRQLTQSVYFAAADTELPPDRQPVPASVQLAISYDVIEGTKSGTSLVATIEGRLRPTDDTWMRPLAENVLFERALTEADRERVGAIAVELLTQAVEAIGAALINQARLREAPDAELISVIADSGPSRTWAIAVAGDRRLSSATDVLANAYASEDTAVSDAALTALVEIGDPSVVPALTDAVDFKDYDQVRAVVEAVSALGGEDAATFLEFVASGHADPGIAKRAREALERMPRRADAAP